MPNKLLMKLLIYIQTPSACPQDSGNSIMHTVFNLNTVWIMYHMPSKFWMKLLIHFQTSKQHRLGMMWLIIHAGIKVSQDLGFVIFTDCFRPQACTGEHLSDTGMWYTILSPAIPTVCLEVMSENFRTATSSMTSSPQNICIWHNLLCLLEFCNQIGTIFQFHNHPLWLPDAVSGDLVNQKWNQFFVDIAA